MSEREDRDTNRDTTGGQEPPVVIRDRRKIDPYGDKPRVPEPEEKTTADSTPEETAAESSKIEQELAERVADLQRIQAEYANYRKRVDRDRVVVGEVATAKVIEALLPVLDDLDRAEEHGDLTGAFKAVADQLDGALTKLGLAAFGAVGDPFDPAIHEAVMHDESVEVTEPTCTIVMRRGYRVGERLVRPAMVGVSDPTTAAPEQLVQEEDSDEQ